MKIYLVRHGETDWNQAGRLQGQTDIDLDAQGFAQAAEAAERLKEVPFEIAFCSPLIRARHTAETIVGERKITLTTDERLRELNFGPWEGTDVRKIREGANSPFTDPGSYLPPEGAESFAQLYARSGEFVKQVLLPLEGTYETVLVVAHGALNRSIRMRCWIFRSATSGISIWATVLLRFWNAGKESCLCWNIRTVKV